MNVWMATSEIQCIEKYINGKDTMLEWGAGGSTLHFSKFVKNYYSIEHNGEWFQNVKNNVPINVKIHHVPSDSPRTIPTQKHQFETYINYIDTMGISKYDCILIDGRGRGWCAEKALNYIDENSIVFIHDYFNRPSYFIVETWYEKIDEVRNTQQTLVVLKKKQYVNSNT